MSEIPQAHFDRLQVLVREAIKTAQPHERPILQHLFPFLSALQEHYASLPILQKKLADLQEQLDHVQDPPLQYGVLLGVCQESSGYESIQSLQADQETFWECLKALLAAALDRANTPGEQETLRVVHERVQQLAVQAAKRDVIVGVHGQRYEVNMLASDIAVDTLYEGREIVLDQKLHVVGIRNDYGQGDAAEVANVLSPSGTAKVLTVLNTEGRLRVQWPEGEKFDVAAPQDLLASLRRGDIVQIDAAGHQALAKVKPRLHVRVGGSQGVVVEISNRLFETGVEIGDIVRIDPRLQFAFEKLPNYETGGLTLEEVPDVTYTDIGGLDEQVEAIRDAIELPYIHRTLFEQYHLTRPKGILLHGPPGCGKTMIAKAIANSLTQSIRRHLTGVVERLQIYRDLQLSPRREQALQAYHALQQHADHGVITPSAVLEPVPYDEALCRLAREFRTHDIDLDVEDAEQALARLQEVLRREDGIRSFFLNVKGPELLDKYVGQTEYRIRKIFEEAKRYATFYTPVVIFFDEMEAMFRTRGSGRSSDVEVTIVPQFLSEMDGIETSENVIVIGATNRQDMIDPAILRPGRLDIKIKVERPDENAAMAILALYLTADLPLRADGLQQPAAVHVQEITFATPIVERMLRALGQGLGADALTALLEAIPKGSDVRQALQTSVTLTQLCQDTQIQQVVEAAAQREELATSMIAETVTLLYNPASRLEAVTTVGRRYAFPLREFLSGALLANLVARAKKTAIKRQVASREDGTPGLTLADLRTAIQEEFTESAEQLTTHRLEYEFAAAERRGQPREIVEVVDVCLNAEEEDPWHIPRVKAYRLLPSL